MTNYVYQYQWFYKLKSAVMRIDFSCNREKSLHMYNSFFFKWKYTKLQKTKKNKTTTTQTQKTPKKDTEKKLVMSTFYFLLFLMGCKNPYFTYKPWSKFN